MTSDMTRQDLHPRPIVDLDGLRFRWRSNASSLLSIERLRIAPGERILIEGPSGSGKTTLLNLLAGVITPSQGRIHILGQRLDTMTAIARDHFRADHIGYVFQMFNLIPYLSILENVLLPCRFSRRRRERAQAMRPGPRQRTSQALRAEALRLLEQLDLGEAACAKQPVTQLSVGQQQRVAAARALIGAPEILIADEPTSALDADRREDFLQLLLTECADSKMTLIVVSHDQALSALFDRRVRLINGEIH